MNIIKRVRIRFQVFSLEGKAQFKVIRKLTQKVKVEVSIRKRINKKSVINCSKKKKKLIKNKN